jgi:hypothetical protein
MPPVCGVRLDADNLVAGRRQLRHRRLVHDRAARTTVRASVRTDGTETGFELGSFGASLSADGQVVAFESEGALVAEDSEFPVDVFVHDVRALPSPGSGPRRYVFRDVAGHRARSP